jgi:hypothetical protein
MLEKYSECAPISLLLFFFKCFFADDSQLDVFEHKCLFCMHHYCQIVEFSISLIFLPYQFIIQLNLKESSVVMFH